MKVFPKASSPILPALNPPKREVERASEHLAAIGAEPKAAPSADPGSTPSGGAAPNPGGASDAGPAPLGSSETAPDRMPDASASPVEAASQPLGLAQAMANAVDHQSEVQPTELADVAKEAPPFDRGAALVALRQASRRALTCQGVRGRGPVQITLESSGAVSRVSVAAPFAGTPAESCITAHFQSIRISAFQGAPFVVTQTLTFD
jgi:hypothetical protein